MKNIPKNTKELAIIRNRAENALELRYRNEVIDTIKNDKIGVMRRKFQGDPWMFHPASNMFHPLSSLELIDIIHFLAKP